MWLGAAEYEDRSRGLIYYPHYTEKNKYTGRGWGWQGWTATRRGRPRRRAGTLYSYIRGRTPTQLPTSAPRFCSLSRLPRRGVAVEACVYYV